MEETHQPLVTKSELGLQPRKEHSKHTKYLHRQPKKQLRFPPISQQKTNNTYKQRNKQTNKQTNIIVSHATTELIIVTQFTMKPPNEEPKNQKMSIVDLPFELRHEILQHLDDESLGNFASTSKQCCQDTKSDFLSQKRVAVINCSSTKSKTGIWSHPLVGMLVKIQVNASRFNDRFNHVKVVNHGGLAKINNRDTKPITKRLSLPQVKLLDMSLPREAQFWSPEDRKIVPSVGRIWTHIMPKLEEVDLSYTHTTNATLSDLGNNCSKLAKIACENAIIEASLSGMDLDKCQTLQELYLDNCRWTISHREAQDMFVNSEAASPLSKCLEHLEKVSFKGAKYIDESRPEDIRHFSQVGLMKFVRSAKKLLWFKSDLTMENIAILKKERPEITFVV